MHRTFITGVKTINKCATIIPVEKNKQTKKTTTDICTGMQSLCPEELTNVNMLDLQMKIRMAVHTKMPQKGNWESTLFIKKGNLSALEQINLSHVSTSER